MSLTPHLNYHVNTRFSNQDGFRQPLACDVPLPTTLNQKKVGTSLLWSLGIQDFFFFSSCCFCWTAVICYTKAGNAASGPTMVLAACRGVVSGVFNEDASAWLKVYLPSYGPADANAVSNLNATRPLYLHPPIHPHPGSSSEAQVGCHPLA